MITRVVDAEEAAAKRRSTDKAEAVTRWSEFRELAAKASEEREARRLHRLSMAAMCTDVNSNTLRLDNVEHDMQEAKAAISTLRRSLTPISLPPVVSLTPAAPFGTTPPQAGDSPVPTDKKKRYRSCPRASLPALPTSPHHLKTPPGSPGSTQPQDSIGREGAVSDPSDHKILHTPASALPCAQDPDGVHVTTLPLNPYLPRPLALTQPMTHTETNLTRRTPAVSTGSSHNIGMNTQPKIHTSPWLPNVHLQQQPPPAHSPYQTQVSTIAAVLLLNLRPPANRAVRTAPHPLGPTRPPMSTHVHQSHPSPLTCVTINL